MRVGLISAAVPLVADAGRLRAAGLAAALREAGHRAEVCLLPFSLDPLEQLPQRVAFRQMEFAAHYDLVVAFRSPAEVVRHPRKVVWLSGEDRPEAKGLLWAAVALDCDSATMTGLGEARRILAPPLEAARLAGLGLPAAEWPAEGDWDAAVRAVLA